MYICKWLILIKWLLVDVVHHGTNELRWIKREHATINTVSITDNIHYDNQGSSVISTYSIYVQVTSIVCERLCSTDKAHTVRNSRDSSGRCICCYSSAVYRLSKQTSWPATWQSPERCSALPLAQPGIKADHAASPPSKPFIPTSIYVGIPSAVHHYINNRYDETGGWQRLEAVTKLHIALINYVLTSIIIVKTF